VPLVIGLGAAVAAAMEDRQRRLARLGQLRDQLWRGVEALGGMRLNGHPSQRLAHNLNVSVMGVEGAELHRRLRRDLAVSSGSACSQGEPSAVLAALGLDRAEAAAAIRFGLGRETTESDIERAIGAVRQAVAELRPMRGEGLSQAVQAGAAGSAAPLPEGQG
jgi:cysteine desulfurase